MTVSGPESGALRRTYIEQVAKLAEPDTNRSSYDFDRTDFIQSLTRLRPVQKNTRSKPSFVKERPSSRSFMNFIFSNLGVNTEVVEFNELVNILVVDFSDRFDGLSLNEQRAQIGTTLPANSRIRQAFTELDGVIVDFHGSLYDGELRHAQLLGYFIVEAAQLAVRSGLKEAS